MATKSTSEQQEARRQERRERNLLFLQEQIQRDLEVEAALKGRSSKVTSMDSDRIKQTAQEMVNAAQHARTVVRSEQTKKTFLPMMTSQIAALSQTQARDIVDYKMKKRSASLSNARMPSASALDHDASIHIQAQALEHAYTQALIKEGKLLEDSVPVGLVVPLSARGSTAICSESTPLLGKSNGDYSSVDYGIPDNSFIGGHYSDDPRVQQPSISASWLCRLYAATLVCVVVILSVHYTNSKDRSSESRQYTLWRQESRNYHTGTMMKGTVLDDSVGGTLKSKASTGGGHDAKDPDSSWNVPDSIGNGRSPTTDATPTSSSKSKQSPQSLRIENEDASMKNSSSNDMLDLRDSSSPIREPKAFQRSSVSSSSFNNHNSKVKDENTKSAPTMWNRVSSLLLPTSTSTPNKSGTVVQAFHVESNVGTTDDETIDRSSLPNDVAPPVVNMTLPSGCEQYFASVLLDDLGFYFPFLPLPPTTETSSNKRHLRKSGTRDRHEVYNHHHHQGSRYNPKHTARSAEPSLLTPWSMGSAVSLKSSAAVGDYYTTKGEVLLSALSGTASKTTTTTASLSHDWMVDVERRETLGRTYKEIGDLIKEHYQEAFTPHFQDANEVGGQGERRQLSKGKPKTGNTTIVPPLPFKPDYKWHMDWQRGMQIGRQFRKLSETVSDHYKDSVSSLLSPRTNGTATNDGFIKRHALLAVIEYYNNKTMAIEDFYSGDIPEQGSSSGSSAKTGGMVEDYYHAVYSPVTYKKEMMSHLPKRNPDKDFPPWGHKWRDDRDHRIALDRYWRQYHSTMDAYYKNRGEKLSTQFQEYYRNQFVSRHNI